jgi:hypothetical protein
VAPRGQPRTSNPRERLARCPLASSVMVTVMRCLPAPSDVSTRRSSWMKPSGDSADTPLKRSRTGGLEPGRSASTAISVTNRRPAGRL